jgi:hypothetical protein
MLCLLQLFTGRRIHYNRLSISRCYEKRRTRHRAAPARKRRHTLTRSLTYPRSLRPGCPTPLQSWRAPVACRRWARRVRALPERVADTRPPMGVSAKVGPQDGPLEIGLRAASLLVLKKREKRGGAPLALTHSYMAFSFGCCTES